MDPTIDLTTVKPSSQIPVDRNIIYPVPLSVSEKIEIDYNYNDSGQKKRKKKIDNQEVGPYSPSKIGNSIFTHFDAVKLANIDSVFKLTRYNQTHEVKDFTYLAINPSNGGYHQYLQFRQLYCYGYSVTTQSKERELDKKYLDMSPQRLEQHIGHFIDLKQTVQEKISSTYTDGIDLIVSNKSDYSNEDVLFFISQLSLSLHLLKGNGYWIMQLSDIDDSLKDCIYLAYLSFENVYIFKPMAGFYDDDLYLICKNPKTNMSMEIDNIYKDIKGRKTYPVNLLKVNPINLDFLSSLFMIDINTIFRHEKALIYWELPGTPEPGVNPLDYKDQTSKSDRDYKYVKFDVINKENNTKNISSTNKDNKIPALASPKYLPPETSSPRRFIEQ